MFYREYGADRRNVDAARKVAKIKIPSWRGDFLIVPRLFLLFGVCGDVAGIAPNHDEHHCGFVENTDDDWA